MTSQELIFLTSEEIAAEVAKQIKEHRINAGYKQKDFAEKIGIPYPTYQLFERTGKTSFINFLTIMSAIGKKDVIFKSLELDDIERIGIKAHQQRKENKKRQRVR